VGWITNFIHNPNTVHVNMLRGWSGSTIANAVSRTVVGEIDKRLANRGLKRAKRGFLLDAESRFDKRRKLTMKGGGKINYVLHNKNSGKVDAANIPGLVRAITGHATQLDLAVPHQVSTTALVLNSGVRINGRPWREGNHCFFFLPTDRRIDSQCRVGIVRFFVLETIGRAKHLFVVLDEREEADRYKSLVVFDVTRPLKNTIVHVDHVTHLVGSLPFWHAGRPDIRTGVPIASTM
jgi:hypothetical protein